MQSHTGVNIVEEIWNVLDEWNLFPDNVSVATTDNTSNMVLAMELMEWMRIPCFSHSLQLTVEAALSLQCFSKMLTASESFLSLYKVYVYAMSKVN